MSSLTVSKGFHMQLYFEANIDGLTRQKEALNTLLEAIIKSNDPEKRLRKLNTLKDWEVKAHQELYYRGCEIQPLLNEELVSSISRILDSRSMPLLEQNEKCAQTIKNIIMLLDKKIGVFQKALKHHTLTH